MFGITKSTSELTAVAQTPECRYHLGLGINNVQVAVNGMDGDKRSHFVVIMWSTFETSPHPMPYCNSSKPMDPDHCFVYAAEMDGHVLGTLCAVTMALLTNRLACASKGWSRKVQIHGDPHTCTHRTRRRTQA